MTKSDIDKIRGLLLAKGWAVAKIAAKFKVGKSAIYMVISGDSTSERIQRFIEQKIGYWPWARRPGEPKHV